MITSGMKLTPEQLHARMSTLVKDIRSGILNATADIPGVFAVIAEEYPNSLDYWYSQMEALLRRSTRVLVDSFSARARNTFSNVLFFPDGESSTPPEVIPKGDLCNRLNSRFSDIRKTVPPSQWIDHLLTSGEITFLFCVLCGNKTTIRLRFRAYNGPFFRSDAMWFKEKSDSIASFLATQYGEHMGLYAPVAGVCGSAGCVSRCRCGNWVSPYFSKEEVLCFFHNRVCPECSTQSLVYLERPELDQKGLRDYTTRFRKLGR